MTHVFAQIAPSHSAPAVSWITQTQHSTANGIRVHDRFVMYFIAFVLPFESAPESEI